MSDYQTELYIRKRTLPSENTWNKLVTIVVVMIVTIVVIVIFVIELFSYLFGE